MKIIERNEFNPRINVQAGDRIVTKVISSLGFEREIAKTMVMDNDIIEVCTVAVFPKSQARKLGLQEAVVIAFGRLDRR